MTYLDKVVAEILRKYPPLPMLNRECSKPYKIPGTDTVLEKGIPVFIPVTALHYDPNYYPEPERFDPERFSDEEKQKRHHYVYLPFGEGPRICIGPVYVLPRPTKKHGVPVRFTSSGRGDAADLYLGSCLHLLQVVIHLLEET